MAVFVLDKHHKPLMPCSEKRARLLLNRRRARIHSMAPFTIRLVDRTVETSQVQPVRCKIDPGSQTTGIALVRENGQNQTVAKATSVTSVLYLLELKHRGSIISQNLKARRAFRNRRRGKLRYRPP